jgi:hypothetical protein
MYSAKCLKTRDLNKVLKCVATCPWLKLEKLRHLVEPI